MLQIYRGWRQQVRQRSDRHNGSSKDHASEGPVVDPTVGAQTDSITWVRPPVHHPDVSVILCGDLDSRSFWSMMLTKLWLGGAQTDGVLWV